MRYQERPLRVGDVIVADQLGSTEWIVVSAKAPSNPSFPRCGPDPYDVYSRGWCVELQAEDARRAPVGLDLVTYHANGVLRIARYQDGIGYSVDERFRLGPCRVVGRCEQRSTWERVE